jgi:hypothetical protein
MTDGLSVAHHGKVKRPLMIANLNRAAEAG